MRVHVHTKFCFFCVLTFLFHQSSHSHGDGHHQHDEHHHANHNHAHSDLQISEAPYVRRASPTRDPKSSHGVTLEEEQHFYIQQLFKRYGEKDRLDFNGFQSLLFSLGLGEVKVVEVDHEELGHDHVAHLDVLDMQEGLHSHSSHSHGHRHEHGHPHHKPSSHHPATEHASTKCSSSTTEVSPAAGAPTDHVHEHSNEQEADHNHDHTKLEGRGHKHANGRAQDTLDHDHDVHHDHDHDDHHDHDHDHDHDKEHKHEQVQLNHKAVSSQPHSDHDHSDHDHTDHDHTDHDHTDHDHTDHDHSDHDHSDHDHSSHDHSSHDHREHDHDHGHVDQTQLITDIPPINQEQIPTTQPQPTEVPQELQSSPSPKKNPKKLRKPGGVRGQQRRGKAPDAHDHHGHEHGHDHDHVHSHIEKREAPGGAAPTTTPDPIFSGHAGGSSHQHEQCLNLTQLLDYYNLSPESLISPSQFTYLCPALLYQIDSRVCIRHYHQMDVEQESLKPASSLWIWLWGFVSITIISLLSLLGVVLVPILNQACFKFLLTFLVALAVGTLSGDALLHLLPHSQGQHDHSEAGKSHETDMMTEFDGVWKGLMALSGIYFLFIIEHCIGMFKHYKDQRNMKKASEEGKIGRKLSDHKLNRRSDAEWLHLNPINKDAEEAAASSDNDHNDTQLTEVQSPDSPTNKTPLAVANPQLSPVKANGHKSKHHGHGHGHSHGGNCHSDQEMKDAGIASIAWMVIMGDGMHNFSDGLAIGAAFSANLTGGISTSVAVFCHELPHELGDFAVLLKAGMSVKQAIVYNLLSALMAYVGMLIGTAVGQYTHNLTSWIFAITAGMFLYVALVDMLPEMLHGDSEEHKRCQLGHFLLQNLGMLTGFGIMLLIAIFEDRIVFDFGF